MGSTGKTSTSNNLNTESGMAKEMYGKSFSELTDEQKDKVTQAVIDFKKKDISGEVSFAQIVNASDNKVSFDRINTATLGNRIYQTKKGEIGKILNESGVTEFVGNMYRDKSGANDLKRIQDAGFEVVAVYKGESQGEVPARDYYFFRKKGYTGKTDGSTSYNRIRQTEENLKRTGNTKGRTYSNNSNVVDVDFRRKRKK